jgi:LysM repeat protein
MFASLFVATLGALPLFTQGVAATSGDCTRTYTVKSGDTCNSIGAAQGASTYQILAINPEIDYKCENLMPDQSICLGTEGADCTDTYVVKSGDTCHKIATAHGVNTTQLYTNNPNIDENCHNIYTGEVLCVGGDHVAPDVPKDFFKNETIATNEDPQPNTPYVPPSTPSTPSTPQGDDEWEVVDPSDLEDGEDVPYCDEVY